MNKYDAWLQAPYVAAEDDQEKVDQRICNLLNGEYDPDNFQNFLEAISEDALYIHKDSIEEALKNNDKATLGLLIQSAVFTYWEKKATETAEQEEAAGML